MIYRIYHIWMASLPRNRLVMWTYSMWHDMSFKRRGILESFCATIIIALKSLLYLRFDVLICLILGCQLIWVLLIILNGFYIFLRVNLLFRCMLHLINRQCLWVIIPILPKIFPILTKILLWLKEIHHLLGERLLRKWLHHFHFALLISIRKFNISCKFHFIYFNINKYNSQ